MLPFRIAFMLGLAVASCLSFAFCTVIICDCYFLGVNLTSGPSRPVLPPLLGDVSSEFNFPQVNSSLLVYCIPLRVIIDSFRRSFQSLNFPNTLK